MKKQIKAIYKKEFYSYFGSLSAYFIISLYIALSLSCALIFGNFFSIDNRNMVSFFRYQPDILAALIPGITMHLWTDEYRSGTIEFLLTQPLEYKDIVIGKYLASVSFSLIMLSTLIPQMFLIKIYGNINWLTVLSGYLCCALITIAFCAVGGLISACSKKPALAYLGSLLVIWSITVITPDKISQAVSLADLGFQENYQNLINGKVSLSSILYYISMALISLWGTIAVINNRQKI